MHDDKITISTAQLFTMFPDQETARTYLESRRWPNGPHCPICGMGDRIGNHSPGLYRCLQCKEAFSVRTGTVMERSHVPLQSWIVALGLIADEPEISSELLARTLGVTQKTGWLIRHRVHEAARDYLWGSRNKRITYKELTA